MLDSFEDYISVSDQHINSFGRVIDKFGVFGYIKTVITDIRDKYKNQFLEGYSFILWNCKHLYKLCKDKNLPEYPQIEILTKSFYSLDTKCGNALGITPDLSNEEFTIRINALDQQREKFKNIFIESYSKINDSVLKLLFVEFSRLIFKFSGYQAPYRLDKEKALQDAMGLTDLFGEFLEEVGVLYS